MQQKAALQLHIPLLYGEIIYRKYMLIEEDNSGRNTD